MSKNLTPIYRGLRGSGFSRTRRSLGLYFPHIYECREEFDGESLVYIAQIWPDGKHRISHSWAGYAIVPPTYFDESCEIPAVLKEQQGLVHLTQVHVKKIRDL